MLDVLTLLEKSGRTIGEDLKKWFAPYKSGAAYWVVSDYCLNDPGKKNDVYSFEIVLKHDTLENISEYIRAVAPRDLKASRKTSAGLGQYLVGPVTFSVSFVVAQEASALRRYASVEAIKSFIPEARALIQQWIRNSPEHAGYFGNLDRQLQQLGLEMARKQRPDRLIRQIFLVATFGAYVLELLDIAKAPGAISWISDRDAMFDRHDGLAFDLALMIWLVSRSSKTDTPTAAPRLSFGLPGMDGVNEYAEMIRLPDYLAGILADLALPDMEFSHGKFPSIFTQVFVNGSNNAVLQLEMSGDRMTTRRLSFGAPRRAWQPLQPGQWAPSTPSSTE